MNVCMLVWSYWPIPTGGAEGQCRKLSHSLRNRNIQCTVLTARLQFDTPGRENENLVDIVRIPVLQMWIDKIIAWRDKRTPHVNSIANVSGQLYASPKSTSSKGKLLAKLVRWLNTLTFIFGASVWLMANRRKIDIIHVHIGDWIAGYAGWIGARLGLPVVCKAANLPVFPILDNSIPFRKNWEEWRKKIHYVAMHSAIRDELIRVGVSEDIIRIIPNGVELPTETAEPSKATNVLFVGNFSQGAAHKGFDILCKAWEKVNNEIQGATLVMAGHGDTAPWQNIVNIMGCATSVHFTGYVKDVADLYRNAALLVLPSRHEGMSNALLEAQSWGLPAIVSDIPGNRAVIIDGVTGLIVPVGDQTALAKAILLLLKAPKTRDQMGIMARKRILEHFAMDLVTEQYIALYSGLVLRVHHQKKICRSL